MKKIAIASLLAILTSGCTTQTYLMANSGNSTPSYNKMQYFFVSGIGQEQEVNAAEVCDGADKIAKVQTQQTFLNGLLSNLTYGLFTPRQIRVYCK